MTFAAISGEVTERPSGGSTYSGSMLTPIATGRLPVGVTEVDVVALLVEGLQRPDELFTPEPPLGQHDENFLAHRFKAPFKTCNPGSRVY